MTLVFAFTLPAHAALGESEATVEADRNQMRGTLNVSRTYRYSVHEMVLPSGTTVREYVSPAGVVFGVAWEGPFMPDLRQLLGSYYEQYGAAVKARHAGRAPLVIDEPRLVVRSSGHMRAFAGQAFLPGIVPQGVGVEELK